MNKIWMIASATIFSILHGTASPSTISTAIHVDQFGYLPEMEKVAVISRAMTGYNAPQSYTPSDQLEVRDWFTDAIIYTGPCSAWNNGNTHSQSGDQVWWFDFSDVTTDGAYYIWDAASEVGSVRFEINPCVYQDVFDAAFKAFYYQRCGMAKSTPYALNAYTDNACHIANLQDTQCRRFDDLSAATERDLSGGWHDAGDYNKYVNFTLDPVLDLLHAFVENPSLAQFSTAIPDNGSAIPDFLLEVKYELDWLLKMQNEDGSVLSIVGKSNYESASPPSADGGQRVYGPATTSASLSCAAMFAMASQTFQSYDANYANTLADAAISAFDWAVNHPSVTFYNSGVIVSGEQEVDDYGRLARRCCAAIYLFALTGDMGYRDEVESLVPQMHMMQWNYVYPFESTLQQALLDYANLDNAVTETGNSIKDIFANSMLTWNEDNLPAYLNGTDAYRAYLSDQNYTWGSNTTKGHQGQLFINLESESEDVFDQANAFNAAAAFVHYFHGVNPNHKVFLTNMNSMGSENAVTSIYHAWFTDGSAQWDDTALSLYGPAPGFVPGGPNPTYALDGCCPNNCGSSEFNALCDAGSLAPPLNQPIQKSWKDWNTNWPQNSWTVTEIGIYTQAAYLRLLAHFVSFDCNTIDVSEPQRNNRLLSVRPMPASQMCFIEVPEGAGKAQSVEIVDIMGRSVLQQDHPLIRNNALVVDLSALSNGQYIVSVKCEQEWRTAKLEVLKTE